MRKVLVLLLALASLPVLCQAQTDVTNYQVDVISDWVETNPSCVSNCTETISMDYEFELNLDYGNPTSPTSDIYGWYQGDTFQINSSGFLGSFVLAPHTPEGLWGSYGPTVGLSIYFFNRQGDDVGLSNQVPSVANSAVPSRLLLDCNTTETVTTHFQTDPPLI
jgi:hypothetical protein